MPKETMRVSAGHMMDAESNLYDAQRDHTCAGTGWGIQTYLSGHEDILHVTYELSKASGSNGCTCMLQPEFPSWPLPRHMKTNTGNSSRRETHVLSTTSLRDNREHNCMNQVVQGSHRVISLCHGECVCTALSTQTGE